MRVIKITFLQTFLFKEIFMYKIRLDSIDNINETIEIITPDINEALDELLMFRKLIIKKDNKWITDFISIKISTNNIEQATSILLDFKTKESHLSYEKDNIYRLSNKCIIKHLNKEYSDDSITPINILESMKVKNNSLNDLINNLKLKIIQ